MLRRLFIWSILLLSCTCLPLTSQESRGLQGEVRDRKTREPVIGAAIQIRETERWTISDEQGHFVFGQLKPGAYTLEIRCLGYEQKVEAFRFDKGVELTVLLVPTAYDMEEVNVLAKKGSSMASSSTIASAAIEHVQATGLSDVMQLLPGNLAVNPDLSKPQQMAIREIGRDVNSAMGTSILVDNAPLSNDANLQAMATSVARKGGFSSVAGAGVDLRRISSDNIESVEVIRGIPSVVYGDLTSGAVVVKTKAGYSPFSFRLKADPKTKQLAAEKGVRLPSSGGFLNMNIDYLSSYSNVVSRYEGYKRLTGQLAYSTTWMKASMPLTFHARLGAFGTLDNARTDPDALVAEEEYESAEKGVRLNLGGKWLLNKRFLSDISYTWSLSSARQESYQKMYRSSSGGVAPVSLALEAGENEGIYLPTEQLTELRIDGRPVNVFGQLTLKKVLHFDNGFINSLLAGGDYRFNKNYGAGQLYDVANPPFISSLSSRPRSFRSIPAQAHYSLYLEDRLVLPLGTRRLKLQGGLRLNNFQPRRLVKSDVGFYLEPRLNISFELLNKRNNRLFRMLSLNAGIGKTHKAPSLLYLYPDRAYYDLSVLDYYTGNPETRMAVFNTLVYDTENPVLRPSDNLKQEIGLEFVAGPVSGSITFFRENLSHGFQFNSRYEFISSYRYLRDSIPPGTKPDPGSLPTEDFAYIISYRSPGNNRRTLKSGIEFVFKFGKIDALYTSFNLDGAYLRTVRCFSTVDYPRLPSSASPEQFKRIGMYPAGESKVSERLNTNLRMVTQVPALRMILSTTLQMVWFDKYYYPFYDEAPIYLFDRKGNITPYTEAMRSDPAYMRYYNEKRDNYYLTELLPPLFLANIRLSKEIGERMKLSFFVNNFMNYRPMYQYIRSESYTRRNPSIYFGSELIVKI